MPHAVKSTVNSTTDATNLQSKSFTLTNCVVRAFGMTPFVHRFGLFMRVMISFRVPQVSDAN